MATTDYRIPRRSTDGMNDGSLFWAVIERAWPDVEQPDVFQKLRNCTSGQRALLAITMFIREVDNGGLEQFFGNTSGDLAPEVIRGFELLGAFDKANVLRSAMAFFGIAEPFPPRTVRRQLVRAKDKSEIESVIEPLNRQLYGEQELWPLFRKYLEAYPVSFSATHRADNQPTMKPERRQA